MIYHSVEHIQTANEQYICAICQKPICINTSYYNVAVDYFSSYTIHPECYFYSQMENPDNKFPPVSAISRHTAWIYTSKLGSEELVEELFKNLGKEFVNKRTLISK